MSSTYNSTSTSVDAHSSRQLDDNFELTNNGQFTNTAFENNHLSPYNNSQTISNSASPSYNINNTPGASSDYSNYQGSEYSEVEDPFFGVNFDTGVQRIDSLPHTLALGFQRADLNRPLPELPVQQESKPPLSATFSTSTYPLSPIHSSIPNTPSPKQAAEDIKGGAAVSQHELITELYNSRFQTFNHTPTTSTNTNNLQLTPDLSGSSHSSGEGIEPSNMARHEHSPRVMVSHWGNPPPQNNSNTFVQSNGQFGEGHIFGDHLLTQSSGQSQREVLRDDEGSWQPSVLTGQAGLDPETRKNIANMEVPSLKEQEEQRRLETKNIEVEEWRSQAGSDIGDEHHGTRFPPNNQDWYQQPNTDCQRSDEANVGPVDDAASVHENRFQDGQTYFDFQNLHNITEADKALLSRPRQWNDAPSVPYITTSAFQPPTSQEAMNKYNTSADRFSVISRAATWGTRRRSEPSLADFDGVVEGSFMKKLSIKNSKERPRQISIFDQGLDRLDRLANIVRKRSESKLKRARSSQNAPEESRSPGHPRHNSQGSSLGVPSQSGAFGRRNGPPSINTAFIAMTGVKATVKRSHTHGCSVNNAQTSPKSPSHLGVGLINKVRGRSKSELTPHNKVGQSGIVSLWRDQGGPPVPNLATPPTPVEPQKRPEPQQAKVQDDDEDDDEDDDQMDESDMKMEMEQQADPIVPNYEGFKAHVRRLNPDMDTQYNWLVSRIAHQQEIRYKNLLDLRVKHSQAINNRNCSAGPHCMSLGGSVTLMDIKGNPRDPERTPLGLQLVTDFSDDSNPGEGALTDETFPAGVPMPPTRNLPAEFECQLCFRAKKFQKPSDWTKHVHEDVQPFTCTYDKCKEPKSFKRKADWVRHENERHRHLEWWICQVDDCKHPCYRKDNFLQHLVREHKLPEPKQKTKAAIKKARTTEPAWIMLEACHHETLNRPQDELCKFCGKSFPTWKKLTVHLAKHMEHISLPILRLVEEKQVDANTIISPVEQIVSPVTPLSRTKMESSSPYDMHNTSPNIPMSGFSTTGFEHPAYFQTARATHGFGMQHTNMQQGVFNQTGIYPNTFTLPMEQQPRTFNGLNPNALGHIDTSPAFGNLDSTYTQPKMEQTQDFNSADSGYVPTQTFTPLHGPGYTMTQNFSTAPAVAGYQSNMLGISDAGYGFDPMSANTAGQGIQQQVPMSRAQGSNSSYGHSPQRVTQRVTYFGQQ
jgi:hypothetical protein